MPSRFESQVVTCLSARLPSNPIRQPLTFSGGILRRIHVLIPAGHAGLTGIALGYGGNPTVPFGNQAYYSGDSREIILDYLDNNPGVSWAAFMCNIDTISHSWEVDMEFDDVAGNTTATVLTPLSPTDIIAAGTAALNGP